MTYEREVYRSYKDATDDNRRAHNLPDTWQVASIRAEDDRIIIVCEDGANPFWFSCVFIEQFPSGGRTTSSKDPPPSASSPKCPPSTHISTLPLNTVHVPHGL
jgi:hypothetical protein